MADRLTAAPVAEGQRIESLDVLRGFALLGILAMNVMVFAMPMAAYTNPTVFPEYKGVDRAVYWIVHTFFDLKMMGLFSMLFGAGVVVWSGKAKTRQEIGALRWLWIRRMFWLLVIGMIHAWLMWEGDILVSYALCGLLVLWWLRRLPPLWLVVVACAFFAMHLLLVAGQGFNTWLLFSEAEGAEQMRAGMAPEQLEAAREAARAFTAPGQQEIERQLAALRGGWYDVFRHRAKMTLMMQTQAFAFYIFWRATAMMLLGAALMKMGVLSGVRSTAFYARLAALGYGLGVPMIVAGILYNESHGFEIVRFGTIGGWFNVVGSVPVMLGHVGLIVWVVKKRFLRTLTHALARVGQMAFTNYLMQSVLCSLIFYGFGLGLAGDVGRLGQECIVVGIWLVEILWSVAWLKDHRFGPAEWLWRTMTYWRLQPMLRAAAPAPRLDAPA